MKFYTATEEYCTFEKWVNAPYCRYSFTLQDAESAVLAVTSPGFYELFVNGQRITKGRFSPGVTNPDHRITVDHYDILPYLHGEENVIGVLLGNGMANPMGMKPWGSDSYPWRSAPSFAMEAQIEDKEGRKTITAADFVTAPSPILFDDMRAGEWYDARMEQPGWMQPGFDDSTWKPVIPAAALHGILCDADIDPILPAGELSPVSAHRGGISIDPTPYAVIPHITREQDEEGEGVIYDFGVNTTGVVRLTVKNSKPGQKILLQYGEILGDNPTGGVNTTIRTPGSGLDLRSFHSLPLRFNHRDVYICRGAAEETWEPIFTIHGFRYVMVFGADAEQISLTAVILHTALHQRADFHCSDDTVNRIYEAALRSDLGNFCHYLTDCPHREKNYWLGDAMVSAEHMVQSCSCERNLTDWLRSFRPAMRPNGELPGIVPSLNWGWNWGPAWEGALVEIPYQIYKYRGDLTSARESATEIFRQMMYFASRRDRRGLLHGFNGCDWVQAARGHHAKPKVPGIFTNTVLAMDLCKKAACLFNALGDRASSEQAETLSGEYRRAIRKYLMNRDELCIIYRCQTAQAMALYYDLFDPAERPEAFKVLLQIIEENGDAFDCGILGMRVIFHVLSRFGRSDLAFRMILGPEFPSYGYLIRNGATTLWELFSPIEYCQSSCNHHFFGDVSSWFIQHLGGIRLNPFDEDVNDVWIAPSFVKPLRCVTASLEVPAGTVQSAWQREGENIIVKTTIPSGMNAELRLEAGWQTDEGYTALTLSGNQKIRVIPANNPDKLRRFAK